MDIAHTWGMKIHYLTLLQYSDNLHHEYLFNNKLLYYVISYFIIQYQEIFILLLSKDIIINVNKINKINKIKEENIKNNIKLTIRK